MQQVALQCRGTENSELRSSRRTPGWIRPPRCGFQLKRYFAFGSRAVIAWRRRSFTNSHKVLPRCAASCLSSPRRRSSKSIVVRIHESISLKYIDGNPHSLPFARSRDAGGHPTRRDGSCRQGWDRSRQIRDKPHPRISHMSMGRGRATCGTINRWRSETD
jgi:hypothetical protein